MPVLPRGGLAQDALVDVSACLRSYVRAVLTIIVTSQKGGSGKTTLVRNLAVAAEIQKHGPVALLDMDPQGSLTGWWNRRLVETPILARAQPTDLAHALGHLRDQGVRLTLIDTPPSVHPFVAGLIAPADFALVPVRPSPDDLAAIGPTVDILERAGKRFAFVVTQAKPRSRFAVETVRVLAAHGRVAPTIIHDRTDYLLAAVRAAGVTERAPNSKAAAEIVELLGYVLEQAKAGAQRRTDEREQAQP